MRYEFRMPSVSGASQEELARQILSFLRQHIQELNFVVGSLEGKLTEGQRKEVQDMMEKALRNRGA